MDLLKDFGANLRKLRCLKRMTQEELAFKAKVSVYHISKLESGKVNISIETIYKLAKALSVHASNLLP